LVSASELPRSYARRRSGGKGTLGKLGEAANANIFGVRRRF